MQISFGRTTTIVLAATLCLISTGCSHLGQRPSPIDPLGPGPITIEFEQKPKLLTAVPITVHVSTAPVGDTKVCVSLSMPSMSMPPNTIVLKSIGSGNYVGSATFSMSGKWIATAEVETASKINAVTVPVSVP